MTVRRMSVESVVLLSLALSMTIAPIASAVEEPAGAPAAGGIRLGVDTESPLSGKAKIQITANPRSDPKVVYSVRVPSPGNNEQLRIRHQMQVSRCNFEGDFDNGGDCENTSPYDYTPRLSYRLVFTSGPFDVSGTPITGWEETTCPDPRHHCPITIRDVNFSPSPSSVDRYVNVLLAADDPAAQGDERVTLEEAAHGRLSVFRLGAQRRNSGQPDSRAARKRAPRETPTLPISLVRGVSPRLVYSAKLTNLVAEDFLDVRAELHVRNGGYNFDPLVNASVILSKTPGGKEPNANNGEPLVTARNGENCTDHGQGGCVLKMAGGVELPSNININGTMYLNMVAYAQRDSAQGGSPEVEIVNDGGIRAVRYRRSVNYSGTGAPIPTDRMAAVMDDGEFAVAENGLGADWTSVLGDTKQVAVSGERIGALTSDGRFMVKQGALSAEWVPVMNGVQAIALSGDRIGALTTAGDFYVKEGPVWSAWTHMDSGVKAIALSGLRVASVHTNGLAYVKEGPLWQSWTWIGYTVEKVALSGNRIGALTSDGTFFVKEGAVDSNWVVMDGGVKQIALSGDRIGSLHTDGSFYVKEGALWQAWVNEYNGVRAGALSGTRISVVTTAGELLVKQGSLYSEWSSELLSDSAQTALPG